MVHQQLQKVTRFRRGLAIFLASQSRLMDRFEISRATTRLRAHTSQKSRKDSRDRPHRLSLARRTAYRPKLIPRGARIDGPHNLRRRSRLRSIALRFIPKAGRLSYMTFRAEKARRNRWGRVAALSSAARSDREYADRLTGRARVGSPSSFPSACTDTRGRAPNDKQRRRKDE